MAEMDGKIKDDLIMQESPTISDILFQFKGRITRSVYFKYQIYWSILLIFLTSMLIIFGKSEFTAFIFITLTFLWPFSIFSSLALMTKRLHDRNSSAWYLLLILTIIGAFALVIELLFFDGTVGPNRYGPDPLNRIPTDPQNSDLLPRIIHCPYCKVELELEDYERRDRRFSCPSCGKNVKVYQKTENTKQIS